MATMYLNNSYKYSDFRPSSSAHGSMQKTKNTSKKQDEKINKTLQGVLLNTYIKDNETKKTEMDEITNSLVIPNKFEIHPVLLNTPDEKKEDKEYKKRSLLRNALPYAASAIIATGMALCVSKSYLKSQKLLKPGNVPTGIKLPTVGKNINLRTEEYFAIYMAISEPKSRNVLALLGVLAMSALTYIGKTAVDGSKKVWLKKQEADIKKNFEENIIDIETKSFAGKLDVVREELIDKTNYFKEKLETAPENKENQTADNTNALNNNARVLFNKFLSFRGYEKPAPKLSSINIKALSKKKKEIKNTQTNDIQKPDETNFKGRFKKIFDKFQNSPIGLAVLTALTLGIIYSGGRKIFKNIAEGAKIKEEALNTSREKIRNSLQETVSEFKNAAEKNERETLLSKIEEKLLSLGADDDEIKNTLQAAGVNSDELQSTADKISQAIAKLKFGDKFYVQADPAMGGKEGTQFYIYIDQAKGYIYDVITHPENKFARYLFSAITATGAAGYISKEAIDAVKETAVMRENSNTELELQERLVNTEIRNFKSKKQSAVAPMMVEFDTKLKEGKPKEELKVMAENILLEIKNGPPFVYA